MTDFDDQLMQDAADDARTVAYIQAYLPQELKETFTEDDLYYFLDVLGEYYVDLIERSGDSEEVDIDIEAVAEHLVRQAAKDGQGTFRPEDVRWVVDAELEYGESLEE